MAAAEDGVLLLHCHAGCETAAVVASLGFGMADLFPSQQVDGAKRFVIATYDYVDEVDVMLSQTVRYEPKTFRQRRPDGRGGWIWNLQDTRRVLYRLPQVLRAITAGDEIWIAEGEKDVDALERCGVTATCNSMGAGKWRADYAEVLRGASMVTIVCDADSPGRVHADDVARTLDDVGVPVRIVEAMTGRDAHDHLVVHRRGLDEFIEIDRGATARTVGSGAAASVHFGSVEALVEQWPEPLGEATYHGVAGELVDVLLPHTEADPAALLVHLLTFVGNAAGRTAHFQAGGSRHFTNLFVCVVGDTAAGAKGQAEATIRYVMAQAEPDWHAERVQTGLSSGEGLIHAVRDPTTKRQPIKEKGRTIDHEEVEDDPGVADKRLVAVESEFARVLRVAGRDGNTLSATIRQAWDSNGLATLTRNNPMHATDPHISIIGSITPSELRRELTSTDVANGFANRFLFLLVRRSKLLPDGGTLWEVDLQPVIERLEMAVAFARVAGRVDRDPQARALWHDVYPELTTTRPGLFGELTARGAPQVARLALIYAILDCSHTVGRPHLEAALEVWRYCGDSAHIIFGDALGDPLADEILSLLRAAIDGLTRAEIYNLLGRHQRRERIGQALGLLLKAGLATQSSEETGGRPAERWRANPREKRGKRSNGAEEPGRGRNRAHSAHNAPPRSANSEPRDGLSAEQNLLGSAAEDDDPPRPPRMYDDDAPS